MAKTIKLYLIMSKYQPDRIHKSLIKFKMTMNQIIKKNIKFNKINNKNHNKMKMGLNKNINHQEIL
jgi:hypothetical protein